MSFHGIKPPARQTSSMDGSSTAPIPATLGDFGDLALRCAERISASRTRFSSFMSRGAEPAPFAHGIEADMAMFDEALRPSTPKPASAQIHQDHGGPPPTPHGSQKPAHPSAATRLACIGRDFAIAPELVPEVLSMLADGGFSINGNPISQLGKPHPHGEPPRPQEDADRYYAFVDKLNHCLIHGRLDQASVISGAMGPDQFANLLVPMGIGPDEPRFGASYDRTLRSFDNRIAEAFPSGFRPGVKARAPQPSSAPSMGRAPLAKP